MFQLINAFTGEVVSKHRTLDTALKAAEKFQKGSHKDTFKCWRIEQDGELVAKFGTYEATGYQY